MAPALWSRAATADQLRPPKLVRERHGQGYRLRLCRASCGSAVPVVIGARGETTVAVGA